MWGFGFFGKALFGIGGAYEHRDSGASATSATIKTRDKTQAVTVNIVVNGGVQEVPIREWKRSLSRNPFWKVIDRRDPIAIWEILEYTSVSGLTAEQQKEVSKLLQEIWVQEIFLPSLRSISHELASIASEENCKRHHDGSGSREQGARSALVHNAVDESCLLYRRRDEGGLAPWGNGRHLAGGI
jgi:hypothetical protein